MWVPLFFIVSAYTISLSHSSRDKKDKKIFLIFLLGDFLEYTHYFYLLIYLFFSILLTNK